MDKLTQTDKTTILCKYCIDAIKSRAEKVFVGEQLSYFEDDETPVKCEWCEEYYGEMYECLW